MQLKKGSWTGPENCPTGWSHDDVLNDRLKDLDISSFLKLKSEYGDSRPSNSVIVPKTKDVKVFCTMWNDFTLVNVVLCRQSSAMLFHNTDVLECLHHNKAA